MCFILVFFSLSRGSSDHRVGEASLLVHRVSTLVAALQSCGYHHTRTHFKISLTVLSFLSICLCIIGVFIPLWIIPSTFGKLAAGAFCVQFGVQG